MLHVTPRVRNGRREKVATKGGWRQDGSKWGDKPTRKPVAHACRMTYQPARGAVSRRNRRRRTLVYAPFSPYAGSKEEARADKEKDRDTQQSGGREKVHARDRSRGKGKEQRSREGTRGSQRTSKGRTQRRGHGGHTASTTPHRDTGEGSTGGPRKEQHHAPRHAPHRHHTHRTHPTNPGNPPGSGRADGRGTAPDPKRPSPWWKAPPPGTPFRHPHSEQRRPARAHAVGPVLGPHAHTDRTRDTRVAEPWLHAPEDGRPGEGQRLAPSAPHNGGRQPPPGTPFRHPHSEQHRPARAHAVGPVLGPHARIDRTRDTRVAEPWLYAPEDERPGEGQRLTPGAPHNGGRHPPRRRPSANPTASNAGPQGRTLWGRCWAPTPTPTAPGTRGSRNPGCTLRRTGGRGRDSAWHQAPLTTVEGSPPRGRPSATPTASNAGPQGRTLWGRCWVHTPTSTAPGTHGSRNPGCTLRRTSGRGRGSA